MKITLLLLSCCFFAACKASQQSEKYALISTSNPTKGRVIHKNTQALVREKTRIKEYVIRPYVDPNDPNVRMPGGAMHVVTRPSRWNTEPTTANGLIVEPQFAKVRENMDVSVAKSRMSILENKYNSERNINSKFDSKQKSEISKLQQRILLIEATLTEK